MKLLAAPSSSAAERDLTASWPPGAKHQLNKLQHQDSSHPEDMGQEESHTEEMDLAQIQELCIVFMRECPSGALHLHEFKRIFGVQSSSAEESLYIETIFHSFDTNKVKDAAAFIKSPFQFCSIRLFVLYVPPGQHAGLPGVRSSSSPHLTGESGRQTQMVLQDVRQGRKRQAGQAGGETAHQGKTFVPLWQKAPVDDGVGASNLAKMSRFHNQNPLRTDYGKVMCPDSGYYRFTGH